MFYRPRRRSFGRKLSTLFLLIGMTPLALGLVIAYWGYSSSFEKTVTADLERRATDCSQRLALSIERQVEALQTLALSPPLRRAITNANRYAFSKAEGLKGDQQNPNQHDQALESLSSHIKPGIEETSFQSLRVALAKSQGDFSQIVVTDAHGVLIASTGDVKTYYYGNENWWQQTVSSEKFAASIKSSHENENGKANSVFIALPIIDEKNGAVLGVIRAGSSMESVSRILARAQFADTGEAQLRRSDGTLLAATASSFVYSEPRMGQRNNSPQVVSAEARVAGYGNLAIMHFEGVQWNVLITQNADEAFAPLHMLRSKMIAVGAVAILVLLFTASLAARLAISPVQDLHAAAERFATGDLDFRIHMNSSQEIQEVAEAMNRMACDLKRYHGELEESNASLEKRVNERTEQLSLAYSELEVTYTKLERASRLKGEFLAKMSHELRTPLNAIIGFTKLVMRKTKDLMPELQHDNLRKVLISSEHLLNLINDILDLSKIEVGKMHIFVEDFALHNVIDEALLLLQPLAKEKGVLLEAKVDRLLPLIRSDLIKVRQIVTNLLSNAVKFTESGSVTVSAVTDEDMAIITVSDTGIGIPPEQIESIFEDFHQVDGSATRKHGGTGLGLSITKKLSELLGGSVELTSETGVGSEFTVSIPLYLELEEDKDPDDERHSSEENDAAPVACSTNAILLHSN